MNHIFNGVFSQAVDEELISSNPATGVLKQLKLRNDRKKKVECMNPHEVSLFLDKFLDYYPEHYEFFLTAFRIGMRFGELLGLEWGDIDWNNQCIWIKRSYTSGKIGLTKSGMERQVDMSDQL